MSNLSAIHIRPLQLCQPDFFTRTNVETNNLLYSEIVETKITPAIQKELSILGSSGTESGKYYLGLIVQHCKTICDIDNEEIILKALGMSATLIIVLLYCTCIPKTDRASTKIVKMIYNAKTGFEFGLNLSKALETLKHLFVNQSDQFFKTRRNLLLDPLAAEKKQTINVSRHRYAMEYLESIFHLSGLQKTKDEILESYKKI